jgi:hypothetical protein
MKKVLQVRERTIPSHEVEKERQKKSSDMDQCDFGVSNNKNKPCCKEQCPCGVKQDYRIDQKAHHIHRSRIAEKICSAG